MTRYTIETYEGERSVVVRDRGIIVETYSCGDMSRSDAIAMAREISAKQERIERRRDA